MKLRLAQMWDHNGTNMEALGFMYRNYQVVIELDANDAVKGESADTLVTEKSSAQGNAERWQEGWLDDHTCFCIHHY